jgi:hypothetical protein
MRMFIHTRNSLSIAPFILLDTIKALVNVYASKNTCQISIVGSALPASFTAFCNEMKQVNLCTEKEAVRLYKQDLNNRIIHFGTTIKGADNIPQLFIPLTLPNRGNESFIQHYLLNKRFVQWIKKAHKVICINDWAFTVLQSQYPDYVASFKCVYLPSLVVPKFEWQDLSRAQENLTGGHNYFLCVAPLQRVTAILKEFSIFKKWQHTTMHLVFVFDTPKDKELALQQLKGYKFKNDIVLVCADELCMEWIAATYAILWEGLGFAHSSWISYAFEYEVPILLNQALHLPVSWVNAGEVFSFAEPQALSNHFKLYYKDEMYRQTKARMTKEWWSKLNEKAAVSDALDITII